MTSIPTPRTNRAVGGVPALLLAVPLLVALAAVAAPAGAEAPAPYAAQVGAYASAERARAAWEAIPPVVRAHLVPPQVCPVTVGGRTLHRLVLPATTLEARATLCARLRGAGLDCLPQATPCADDQSVQAAPPRETGAAPSLHAPAGGGMPLVHGFLDTIERQAVALDGIERVSIGGPLAPLPAPPPATTPAPPPALSALDQATRAVEAGDHAAAARLLTPLAAAGDAVARHNLALLYGAGRGVPRDDARAFALMHAAADSGLSSAQNTLGVMYLHGKGTPRDLRAAVHWLTRAADAGNPLARDNLRAVAEASLARVAKPEAATGGSDRAKPEAATGSDHTDK